MTLVKVCGLTREEDVAACAELGVDILGFIFYPGSPRYIRPEDCGRITKSLMHFSPLPRRERGGVRGINEGSSSPQSSPVMGKDAGKTSNDDLLFQNHRIRTAGVFVDSPLEEILGIIKTCKLDLVQLHGNEKPGLAKGIPVPVIRSLNIRERSGFAEVASWKDSACCFLFDSGGGTGRVFDWSLLRDFRDSGGLKDTRFFLAGGLNPSNIAEALELKPDGVDLNSGVETSPGVKDAGKIRSVLEKARAT